MVASGRFPVLYKRFFADAKLRNQQRAHSSAAGPHPNPPPAGEGAKPAAWGRAPDPARLAGWLAYSAVVWRTACSQRAMRSCACAVSRVGRKRRSARHRWASSSVPA